MSKESLKVLEMVAEGKISPEEGERLIRALEDKPKRDAHGQFTIDIPDIKIPKIDMGQVGDVCVELKNTIVESAKKAHGSLKRGRAKRFFDFKDYPISVDLPQGIKRCQLSIELRAGKMKLKADDTGDKILVGKVKRVPEEPVLISDIRDGQADVSLKHSLGRCGIKVNENLTYIMNLDNAAADSSLDLEPVKTEMLEIDNNAGNVQARLGGLVERVSVNIKNNAGNVHLYVPQSHALRITISGSLSSHNLEKYGLDVSDGVAVSSDWDENSQGVDIVLKQNVASFTLDWKRRHGATVGASEPEVEEILTRDN